MRDTFALPAIHALVQAAGGAEELRGAAALLGAVGCLEAGSTIFTKTLTVAWKRTGSDQVKKWTEMVYPGF